MRVRPPWERAGSDDVVDVIIDPAQAFGTGAHATTKLCLELLLDTGPVRPSLRRLGAGSGVLAVVAAKLGYGPVEAIDFDPLSVDASVENARVNDVGIAAERVDLRAQAGPWAATTCANLLRPLLLTVAERLQRVPELLIVSGLLLGEADKVSTAFQARGLRELDRRASGEWAAVALRAT